MSIPSHADPDRELVLRCQVSEATGLEGVYRDLYHQFKDRVYNVCYRITGNAADALDASQETFGTVFRRIREFRFESQFSSWVYRIAVNASIDLRRRMDARAATSIEAIQRDDSPSSQGLELEDREADLPMQTAGRQELSAAVELAVDRLSTKLRAITVLRYQEGLSYEELSDILGISIGTVKSRLSRAHAALDRELSPVLDRHFLG